MNKMLRVATSGGGGADWCDISTGSYDSVSFDVSAQDDSPTGIVFKPDGTKMFVSGFENDSIYQYTLATPWLVSTASYDSSFNILDQDDFSMGMEFKPDGTEMYVVGIRSDKIHQYSLQTAWEISSASYSSITFDVSPQEGYPTDVAFKPDGTKMYLLGLISDSVHQYSLQTPWAINTASYDSVSFSVTDNGEFPSSLTFDPGGTKMYMAGLYNERVFQYSLGTAWDISTAVYDSLSLYVPTDDEELTGVAFKPDGEKVYVLERGSKTVYQYSLC